MSRLMRLLRHQGAGRSPADGWFLVLAGVGMISLKIAYLIVELYYNNALQLFGSTPGVDADDIERFHTFGRHIAAMGATLLVAGMWIKGHAHKVRDHGRSANWRRLGTIAPIIYIASLVFQTVALDAIVALSSDRTAYRAYAGGLAQSLVLSNTAEAFGIESKLHEPLDPLSDGTRVLALFPLAATTTDAYEGLPAKRDVVAAAMRAHAFHSEFQKGFKQYMNARLAFVEVYNAYALPYSEILKAYEQARKQLLRPRQKAFVDVVREYRRYLIGQERFMRQMRSLSAAERREASRSFEISHGIAPNLSGDEFFDAERVRKESGLYAIDGEPSAALNIREQAQRLVEERDRAIAELNARVNAELPEALHHRIDVVPDPFRYYEREDVQSHIARLAGGEHFDSEPTLSTSSFFRFHWTPATNDRIEAKVDDYVLAQPAMMGREDLASLRENALKAAYVVPFALCLSTVFLILNAITLFPWKRLGSKHRKYVRIAIAAVVVVAALVPLGHQVDVDTEYTLPVGVSHIARTARLLDIPGAVLTTALPPRAVGLLPESPCLELQPWGTSEPWFYTRCF